MIKKTFSISYFVFLMSFLSCAGQNNVLFIPTPDFSVFSTGKTIEIGEIIQTKDGVSKELIPEWLSVFIYGGIEAVEKLEAYSGKYVFIGINQGGRFAALSKWAENFSVTHDFTMLAGKRIEERMILTAELFPDDEYGSFFETFVKIAFNAQYQDAVKEDTYWIKHSNPEIYSFFILITIDKEIMQSIIRNMMERAYTASSPTGSQAASVNRLRQTFFEGF